MQVTNSQEIAPQDEEKAADKKKHSAAKSKAKKAKSEAKQTRKQSTGSVPAAVQQGADEEISARVDSIGEVSDSKHEASDNHNTASPTMPTECTASFRLGSDSMRIPQRGDVPAWMVAALQRCISVTG